MGNILELTTALAPAETFTVDDESYRLLGIDHLSADQEATVMGYFAKMRGLQERYEATEDEGKAKIFAAGLRDQRVKILCTLTDMPREVCERLPVSGQAQILKYLEGQLSGIGSDEDAE